MSLSPENEKNQYVDSEKHGVHPTVEVFDPSSESKEFAEEMINAESEYTWVSVFFPLICLLLTDSWD